MKKIFATDYDGTLFQMGEVTLEDINAIKEFRSKGGIFGIVTGRMINSVKRQVEHFDIPIDFVIGMNGGVIVDDNFDELHHFKIDRDVAIDISDILRTNGGVNYLISDGYTFCHLDDFESQETRPCHIVFENKVKGLHANLITVDNARYVCDMINNKYPNDVLALNNFQYIDISSNETDKAHALNIYLKQHDMKLEVATAGDGFNDLTMLQEFNGYVMYHGDPLVVNKIAKKVNTVSEAIEDFMKD